MENGKGGNIGIQELELSYYDKESLLFTMYQ